MANTCTELLKRFNVPHDQRYIFQPVEPDSMPLLRSCSSIEDPLFYLLDLGLA